MKEAPPRASVVIATYNRPLALQHLLQDLSIQSVAAEDFEVVIVDDGSRPPIDHLVERQRYPYSLQILTQENQGPAAARNRGVHASRSPIIVFLDDDMRVNPNFLQEHLRQHDQGERVVIGRIDSPDAPEKLPVFERFHLRQLVAQQTRLHRNEAVLGSQLCTGNASLRREAFLAAGGFDVTLPRSEDRDLGLRLEVQGQPFHFAHGASSTHNTDHAAASLWLQRALHYGRADTQIARKHPDIFHASPWRFLFLIRPVARPLACWAALQPESVSSLPAAVLALAQVVDRADASAGSKLTELAYALQYFRGVGQEAGSTENVLQDLLHHASLLADQPAATPLQSFVGALLQDHRSVLHYRAKYHQERLSPLLLPRHLATKTGLQILSLVRLMQFCRRMNHQKQASFIARLLRHAYQVDIHPDAKIAPGISIVHGNGLVISRHASVASGCILFHNVTLGEGIVPGRLERGGPQLQRNVHVGPGSTLLGPIVVGASSKIQAGCIVTQSVPPQSRVFAPEPRWIEHSSPPAETSMDPAKVAGEVAL